MSVQRKFGFMDSSNGREKCATDANPPSQDSVAGSDRTLPSWLGLVTSHRRLFEASQAGWLRPLPGSNFLLGRESFVSEEIPTGRNVIPVRLAFDINKLPFPDARKDLEHDVARNDDGGESRVVHWRAPIPLYAVKSVDVSSIEQKTRLLAMAGRYSNVSLPDMEVAVSDFAVKSPATAVPEALETKSLDLPKTLNAIQGAMAMAVWAVPHVEPWIEVLQKALDRNATGVAEGVRRLDAQWLQLPWLVDDLSGPARDDAGEQEGLWRAALSCMQWPTVGDESPSALAEKIAQAACLDGTNRTAKTWYDRTRRIIAAEERITCGERRQHGAGLAIQLALLRPEPTRFKSWNRDLSGLPPGVWWAAATLCGWRHGYLALDKHFRGDAKLQELIASRALEASWPSGDSAVLAPSQQSSLERTCEDGCFTLTWRGHPVVRKPWQSRAKWYSADLTDVAVAKAARALAAQLGWPCLERQLALPEGYVRTVGSGHLFIDGDALVVEGEKRLRLPNGVDLDERFDPDEFRRQLASEAGAVLDDPPEAFRSPPEGEIPGFVYKPDFITEDDETKLMAWIDGAEWSTELRRRVQHYGWRYDYKQRQIDESMRLGELPEWAQELGRRLVNEGLMKDLPDQVIVNEYLGRQGISRHIDQPCIFAEHVATISLLETWGMVFRHRNSKEKVEKRLARRSVAVLTGDARYRWTHEIPQRTNELLMDRQGKRKRVERSRRISLTFRTTRLGRTT